MFSKSRWNFCSGSNGCQQRPCQQRLLEWTCLTAASARDGRSARIFRPISADCRELSAPQHSPFRIFEDWKTSTRRTCLTAVSRGGSDIVNARTWTKFLQGALSVVDNNQKVVGALSVVGATTMAKLWQIVSNFCWISIDSIDFLSLSTISCNSGKIPWKFRPKICNFSLVSAKCCKNPEKSLKSCKILRQSNSER